MGDYKVADVSLAERGRHLMHIAEHEMKGLMNLRKKYSEHKTLKGTKIAGISQVTFTTAVLIESLVDCGAEVRWCTCDGQTTGDYSATALAKAGVSIFAWKGQSKEEFEDCKEKVLKFKDGGPDILMDYGGYLTTLIHDKYPHMLKYIKGIVEFISFARYYKVLKQSSFKGPIFCCINSRIMRGYFDFYGMRETSIEAIKIATNTQIAGKCCVVCGYGDIGRGTVYSLARLGARVIVSEIDPVTALKAAMEGHAVSKREDCISRADIVITTSGCINVITGEDILKMKDHAIVMNLGHQVGEIDTDWIHKHAKSHVDIKPDVVKYTFESGKSIILLGEGTSAQLTLADGYSGVVMSVAFSVFFMSAIELHVCPPSKYPAGFCILPRKLEEEISEIHVTSLGGKIDKLTEEQAECLGVTVDGPFKQYPTGY